MAELLNITLNGIEYNLKDLSEAARIQVLNVQIVDAEIVRLQQQLAIAQTARNTYVASLMSEIESVATTSNKPKPVKKAAKPKATRS